MATISAAIFDLDGTLIDSMQMWYGVFATLLSRRGLMATPEIQAAIEPLPIDGACAWIHDELGVRTSAGELEAEVYEIVTNAYRHEVKEIEGAHAFVDAVRRAGIPAIVATSTASALARVGLEAQGWGPFFKDVICAGEVRDGHDKDRPDVYLEALERLGAPLAQTWVFEDAPFAIRTARKAGFHVVGLFNDHDGRDEAFVRRWADIFAYGYDEGLLDAIRAFDDGARVLPQEA